MSLFRALLITILAVLGATASGAAGLPKPQEPVLLTITGQITYTNNGNAAEFDREMLEGLEWREIQTFTAYTEGEQTFAGPTLASVLEAVGATGENLLARAINDYTTIIEASDAARHDVILAMDQNGRPMRVRNKGPIWVVYPMTEEQASMSEFDAQMIWQLVSVNVE